MSSTHTAAILQYDVIRGDVAKNTATIFRLLDQLPGERPLVALLPEAATSNFSQTEGDRIAAETARVIERLARRAQDQGISIYGSFVVKDAGGAGAGFYNEGVLLKPDGARLTYRKVHLFEPAGEHTFYKEGSGQVIADMGDGLKAGLTICYDLRFPEWIGRLVQGGANAIFCVAQWPAPRREHWDALLRARAIENLSWVVAVNRIGDGPRDKFSGGSAIFSPWGERAAYIPDHEEGVVWAALDLGLVDEARTRLPTLARRFRNG